MKRFAILLACTAVAFGAQATPQQDKMKTCNVEAKGKKGDERKAFMKECLAAKPAEAAAPGAACEKSAADKKLHGAAAKSHIKKCMADAAASAPS
ncbi:PsiF family protein [Roseateles sp.]|uniref:PsiF family protein n=1 Tax=Roseateles sp. TaxID=1971397 RepID=UPI0039ECF93E